MHNFLRNLRGIRNNAIIDNKFKGMTAAELEQDYTKENISDGDTDKHNKEKLISCSN